MTETPTKHWTSICNLTGQAMDSLVLVEQALVKVDSASLGPLEFRTLVWARCALATLFGIRADEAVNDSVLSELLAQLTDLEAEPLPTD